MTNKTRKIIPRIKTDSEVLFEIDNMKGLYRLKNIDRKSKRYIFQKLK